MQRILIYINATSLLGVEGDKDFVNLVSALVIGGTGGHHVEEFWEFDLSTAILVEFSDHLINSLSLSLNT